jgi:hypothetical protein
MPKREYLKHKLWKQLPYSNTLETDLIDGVYDTYGENIPVKASMRDSAKFGNCNWKPWVDSAYSSDKWDMMRQRLGKFIEARVGKSFNKTFSEFKEKFPETFGKINVVKEFKSRFLNFNPHHEQYWMSNWVTYERNRYWSFYIDNYGIIRSFYLENRKPKNKMVKINKRSSEVIYNFKKHVFEQPEILAIIETRLSKKYRQYLDPEIKFSQVIYDKIIYDITNNALLEELATLHKIEWWKEHYSLWRFDIHCYDYDYKIHDYKKKVNAIPKHIMESFLFEKTITEDCDIIKGGSSEHLRWLNDIHKASKAEWRIEEKERLAKRESLLHDVITKRRLKEFDAEKNRIDRDRLGFDEYSFIGEGYHGQQRKKKNK